MCRRDDVCLQYVWRLNLEFTRDWRCRVVPEMEFLVGVGVGIPALQHVGREEIARSQHLDGVHLLARNHVRLLHPLDLSYL